MSKIKKHISRAMSRYRLMVDFVTDLVFADDGTATGKGIGDSDLDAAVGWHFGFYSRPKDGTQGVAVKVDGQGNSSFLIAFRDKRYEMTLEKGECGMQNAFEAKVLLDKDGKVTVTSKSGQTVELNGSDYSALKTETFFTDLKAFNLALIADLASAAAAPAVAYSATLSATPFAVAVNGTATAYKSTKVKNG